MSRRAFFPLSTPRRAEDARQAGCGNLLETVGRDTPPSGRSSRGVKAPGEPKRSQVAAGGESRRRFTRERSLVRSQVRPSWPIHARGTRMVEPSSVCGKCDLSELVLSPVLSSNLAERGNTSRQRVGEREQPGPTGG